MQILKIKYHKYIERQFKLLVKRNYSQVIVDYTDHIKSWILCKYCQNQKQLVNILKVVNIKYGKYNIYKLLWTIQIISSPAFCGNIGKVKNSV